MTAPDDPRAQAAPAPDVAAIGARAAAATPGPWEYVDDGDTYVIGDATCEAARVDHGQGAEADAAFIAHARADVPALLATLAREREGHAAEVAAAVAAEREACARLCEDRAAHLDAAQGEEEPDDANEEEMEGYGRFLEALHLTDEIRARGTAPDALAAAVASAVAAEREACALIADWPEDEPDKFDGYHSLDVSEVVAGRIRARGAAPAQGVG